MSKQPIVATFSIAACDLDTGEWGVAVQSKFMGVGVVVPWAKANIGAVATQARINTTYGPEGLQLMANGISPTEAISQLTASDPEHSIRQFAMVDSKGEVAAFTGADCMDWAGHLTGDGFSCQGNILAGPEVLAGMAEAYKQTPGDLADRMMAALQAGQEAGGDIRGRQSAAILVVKEDAGFAGFNDRYIDLRVDDHTEPIKELKRLLELYRFTFLPDKPDSIPCLGTIVFDLQRYLKVLGYYEGELDGTTDVRAELKRYAEAKELQALLRNDNRVSVPLIINLRETAMTVPLKK